MTETDKERQIVNNAIKENDEERQIANNAMREDFKERQNAVRENNKETQIIAVQRRPK